MPDDTHIADNETARFTGQSLDMQAKEVNAGLVDLARMRERHNREMESAILKIQHKVNLLSIQLELQGKRA